MTREILLLHSALGLRPAVSEFADRLRDRGFLVHVPDYYDGHVFADTTAGIEYRDTTTSRVLLQRVNDQLGSVPASAALIGFSLGAAFAQHLAATRPYAGAVVLLHHASAPRGPWPGQPVQVHRFQHDDWIDPDDVAELGAAVRASGATFQDFQTPGSGHLFTDPGQPDSCPEATTLTLDRIADLLN